MRTSKEGSSRWMDDLWQGTKTFFSWETANLSRIQVENCIPELQVASSWGWAVQTQKRAVIPPPNTLTLHPNSTSTFPR